MFYRKRVWTWKFRIMKLKEVKDINIKIRNIIMLDLQIDKLIRDYDNYTNSCSNGFRGLMIEYTWKYMAFEKLWYKFILPNIKPSLRDEISEEDKKKLNELVFNNQEVIELINKQNEIIKNYGKAKKIA